MGVTSTERQVDVPLLVSEAKTIEDPWVRQAAEIVETVPFGGAAAQREGQLIMRRLKFLSEVEMFQGLSLEDLEAINGLLEERDWLPGEMIVNEGEFPACPLQRCAQVVPANAYFRQEIVALEDMRKGTSLG